MARAAAVPLSVKTDVAALRQCRLFSCEDVTEARDRIAKILQPHTLLPIGSRARRPNHMDVIGLPGVWINAISFGEARIEVPPLDGYHVVIFCLSGHARMRSGATETDISPHRAITLAPGRRLEGRFSSDCEQIVVRIDKSAFQAHAGMRSVVLDPVIDIGDRTLRPWLMHLETLISSPEVLRMIQSDRRISTNYVNLLIRLLIAGHGRNNDTKERTQCPAPASVFRAEAFIAAHAREPITLQDIAAAARTPVRTLLYGFRRFRETTPMQFLRSVRLREARDRLLRDRSRSIAAVALECGFNHLGRFSREYANKFGELPSATRASGGTDDVSGAVETH
jgi:AraC-like DNA-binding protein